VAVVLEGLEDLGDRTSIMRSTEALGFLNVHEICPKLCHEGRAETTQTDYNTVYSFQYSLQSPIQFTVANTVYSF
jgi:hypothetical protein